MKSRRLAVMVFGTCLFLALTPIVVQAQGTGAGAGAGGGGAGTGTATGVGSSGGGTSNAANVVAPSITIVSPSSGTGSTTGVVSTTNPFVSSYGDALSMGLPSKFLTGPPAKSTVTFGKGIYSTTTTTATSTASTVPTTPNGFTTYAVVRNPQYTTALSSDIPMIVHNPTALQADVRSIIDRSSFVKSQATVQVNVNGGVVVLSGLVRSDREAGLIESMTRTTPGVRGVQNELKVAPQ